MSKRFGRYTLVQRLATGGMAEIWFARQRALPNFARPVVLKLILGPLASDEHFVRMFLDEARVSALLTHPNAVQIYDVGIEDDTFFIAMEYIEGENLFEICKRSAERKENLPLSFCARIVGDACKALHHAHQLTSPEGVPLNLVHRDVSLNNILVSYDGHAKVVDFGLAKTKMRAEVTLPGVLKGRKAYMSPEQREGEAVDRRSDLFSLGVVLYELCTRKRLFRDGSTSLDLDSGAEATTSLPLQSAGAIPRAEIVLPSQHNSNISPKLERIIMRALERDVRLRYQTAEELSIALEDYLRSDPMSTAEIAAHMQVMFDEEIRDKRRMAELISTPDPDETTETDEVQSGKDDVDDTLIDGVNERAPARAKTKPDTRMSTMMLAAAGAALLILGVALGILLAPQANAPEPPKSPSAARAPEKTTFGKVTVNSQPQGAWILVDGRPVNGEDGAPAVTPSEITMLEHGRSYVLTVVKDAYEPWSESIDVGPATDSRNVSAKLVPLTGKVLAVVTGARGSRVEVFAGNQSLGVGPRASALVEVGSRRISARGEGYECAASPATIDVRANQTTVVSVSCTKLQPILASSVRAREPVTTSGCVPIPDLPLGFVTIASSPYATVYRNGLRLGDTPLSKHKLAAGCHELELVTSDGRTRREKITVEPNKVMIYKFSL